MMRTSNPVLTEQVFRDSSALSSDQVMTIEGTVNKTIFSVLLTIAAAYWAFSDPEFFAPLTFGFVIGGLVIALVIIFKKTWAPLLTPLYAIVEGFALGTISLFYAMSQTADPGQVAVGAMSPDTTIVFQAISLTFGTLFCLLMAYKAGLIRATEKFKMGIFAATGAIFLVYMLSLVLGLFGISIPFLHSSGPIGIGVSLFIVVIAALNLILDFDFIENAAASRSAPKYLEWYGAFGLLVTLVWLYLEMLRLLAKIQGRD